MEKLAMKLLKRAFADQRGGNYCTAINWKVVKPAKWVPLLRYSKDPELYERWDDKMKDWVLITKDEFKDFLIDATFVKPAEFDGECMLCGNKGAVKNVVKHHDGRKIRWFHCCAACMPRYNRIYKPLVKNQRLLAWRLMNPEVPLAFCSECVHSSVSTETGDRYCTKKIDKRGFPVVVVDADICNYYSSWKDRVDNSRKMKGKKVKRA